MSNVVQFPGKPKETVEEADELDYESVTKKFIINGEEFIVSSASRPTWFTEEWEVHTLEGPSYVMGPQYWGPLYVIGPEEFADALQAAFPLKKMSLELLDACGIVTEWWEFEDVFLSTETDQSTFVILFREALKSDRDPSEVET